jgi:hypothetical protein
MEVEVEVEFIQTVLPVLVAMAEEARPEITSLLPIPVSVHPLIQVVVAVVHQLAPLLVTVHPAVQEVPV